MKMHALIIDQSKLPKLKYRYRIYPHGGVLSPTDTDLYLFFIFFLYLRDVCCLKKILSKK